MQQADVDWLSDREQSRLRKVLQGMLVVSAAGIMVNFAFAFSAQEQLSRRLAVLSIASVMVAVSAWRLRYSLQQAGAILTLGFWLLAALNAVVLAGVYSSGNVIFPFVIVLAGWLMGRRELVVCTIASMVFLLALALLEVQGLFVPSARAPALTTVVTYLAVMPVIALMTWSMRSILVEGRRHTQELLLVQEQKTRELEQSEAAMHALMENMPAAVASFDMEIGRASCRERVSTLV